MPLILGEVPTPPYSDGTPNFYPTVYKTARAPAGGYAECQQARVQKYLDMLAPGLKDTYAAHPEKIPGIDKAALAHAGGKVVFKSNAVLKRLPEHYKMFESRKVEASADSAAGTPTTGSPAQGQPPSRLGNGSDTTTPKREFDVKKEGDASGKRASALKTSKFRSDAYIFGHPSGSKFRSTTEFAPHLSWLVTDETRDYKNCPCKLCQNFTKSGGKSYPRGTKLAEPVEIPTAEPPAHLKTPSNSMPPEGPVLGQGEGKSQKKKVVTKALPSLLSDDVAPRRDWELDYGRSSERNTPVDIPRNDADSEDRDERESKAVGVRQGQPKPSKDERVDRYDDAKYKRKYRELKHKISEVEEDNQRLEDEYLMAKKRLSRIKFERQLLLDRLQVVQAEAAGGEEHSGEFSDSNSSSGTSRSPPDSLQRHEEQQRGSKGPPKQRKKREKKIVDPNAPRRPANAFMFFCDQSRELLKKERGSMREAEIKSQGLTNLTKALGARWKALNSEERLDWKARYLTEVKRYHGEMAQYEQSEAPGSKKRKIGDVTTPAQSGASPAHSPHRQNHHPQETRSHDRYDEEIGAVPDDDYSGQEDDENDEEDRNDDADPNGMDVDDFSDGDSLDDDPSSVRLHPSAQSWKAGSPGPAFKNGHVYG